MARLLYFTKDGSEYVVLSSDYVSDENFKRPGYQMKVYQIGDQGWPVELPVDRELTAEKAGALRLRRKRMSYAEVTRRIKEFKTSMEPAPGDMESKSLSDGEMAKRLVEAGWTREDAQAEVERMLDDAAEER